MAPVHVTARVESDTLTLPELLAFAGKTVVISIAETTPDPVASPGASDDPLAGFIDTEYHAQIEAEEAAELTPPPTIEEVRAILSKIPGSLAADVIADRGRD